MLSVSLMTLLSSSEQIIVNEMNWGAAMIMVEENKTRPGKSISNAPSSSKGKLVAPALVRTEALKVTHAQKIKAPNEGGNSARKGQVHGASRELWLLMNAPVEEGLVRLPTLSVEKTTYEAYLKVKAGHTGIRKPVSAVPTHCQSVIARDTGQSLWLIYWAPSVLSAGNLRGKAPRQRSYTLEIMTEEELTANQEYLKLVQNAKVAKVIGIEEGPDLPEIYKEVTTVPVARLSTSEYKAWLIFWDLFGANEWGS
jgi:hypothetical protein